MMRTMRDAKGPDRTADFSPPRDTEASNTSHTYVSPILPAAALHASLPSHSRSRIFTDGAIAHINGASVESAGDDREENRDGSHARAETKRQDGAPEQDKTREKEERARERQQLRLEIERERERSTLREMAGESLREGGLEWERAQERIASSSGPKALRPGEEMGAGDVAHGNREGEVSGWDQGVNTAGMPSILRKFELEQVGHTEASARVRMPLLNV